MFKSFRSFLSLALTLSLTTSVAVAENTPLESLDTWGRNRGWEGVGLLNIAGKATCTGVMIRTDLVLTAAHCLYDDQTKQAIDPRKIQFRAGWREGKAIAQRYGRASVIHPKYINSKDLSEQQIRHDVALLQLADPIYSTHAEPFRTDKGIATGNQVSVVSYGRGRNDAPSRQRSCDVIEAERGLVMMTCDVVPGSSGSPVFALRDGQPRIVSLVSAVATVEGRQVSFGMDLTRPLADVLSDFRAGRTLQQDSAPTARRITVGKNSGNTTGARFLKP